MALSDQLPYPPGPEPDEVPEDYADFPETYVKKERFLLICLFLFLMMYIVMVLMAGLFTAYCVMALWSGGVAKIIPLFGIFIGIVAFIFLVKGFFKTPRYEKDLQVEVTKKDHPKLIAFIQRVCEETGAEEPNRIYLVPDVNAGVRMKTSFINIVSPPKKDLVIGLGLINCLNLSEFKAVMAHEFGHFTQGGFLDAYTNVVGRIMVDMVNGEDWFDDIVNWMKNQGSIFAVVGVFIGGILWMFRTILNAALNMLAFQRTNIAREGEFHADLVAASLAGSDAIVHGLLKTKFGAESFGFALDELRKAADHKLYTADIYFHQHAAAELIRKKKKDPMLGKPPALDGPLGGKKVQIFDPDTEEDPGDVGDYHPSNYDREENVKKRFIPAPLDERSPWLLFENPAELRERISYKLYRVGLKVPKGTELTDPRKVQKFIDDEHQETTYDPRYEGVYDDGRFISPGDIDDLNEIIQKEPWPDDRLIMVHAKLYHDLKGRAEDRLELVKERDRIERRSNSNSRKAKRLLKQIEQDLEKADEWFHSLDRRAYLVHVQMAYRVNNDYYYELINRYRFHMAIQGIYKSARHHAGKAFFFFNFIAGQDQLHEDDFVELMHVLRDARKSLKKILREARELDMPAMKNFEEGERLGDFLLDQDIVPELPETYVKGKWIDKLLTQLDQVMSKAARLHFKSLGGILKLQEEISAKFLASRQPMEAEIIKP